MDAQRRRGIDGALVIALKPGVNVQDFVRRKDKDMAYTSARTGPDGRFTLVKQLLKGQAYGLVVIARGYKDLVVEGALRVTANAPEQAELNPIPLQPERRGLFG